ncbi:MAG TPA: ubiquitin-like domain-containing protein [Candidatus Saccharimonadales bacterium]|nr:ubiquitin-like domain-containing protein [Candidatus Saccharimonadales bacterium]
MQAFWKKPPRPNGVRSQLWRRWHEHPLGLPIALFVGLVLVGAGVLLVLAKTHRTATFHPDTSFIAIISHDNEVQTVPTKEPTVGDLLHKLHIPLNPRDRVEPSLDTAIEQDNFRINIYRSVPVTITDGTTVTTAYSAAATPRSIVADAGLPLYAEDGVTAGPSENLLADQSLGKRIVIDRSVPLTLNDYGTMLSIRTHATTVAGLLDSKGIKLQPQDTVIPDVSTPITPGMQVFVTRKGSQIVAVTETIPAPQQIITDYSLSFGTSAVRQQGSDGTQVLTYQVNTENGVETSRVLLQTVVTVQPVPQVLARGLAVSIPEDKQAVMRQAGIATADFPYVDYIASHEGAWCPTKIQGTHNCPGYMNPSDVPAYGGYGIFQATPGGKMASAGADWATSAVTQIRWATGYAVARYGSWEGAYNHWTVHHNW